MAKKKPWTFILPKENTVFKRTFTFFCCYQLVVGFWNRSIDTCEEGLFMVQSGSEISALQHRMDGNRIRISFAMVYMLA